MQTSGTVNLCRDALVSDERNDEEKQKKTFPLIILNNKCRANTTPE